MTAYAYPQPPSYLKLKTNLNNFVWRYAQSCNCHGIDICRFEGYDLIATVAEKIKAFEKAARYAHTPGITVPRYQGPVKALVKKGTG